MTKPVSAGINENCLFIYETIEKNKPKVYVDAIDQICSIINKNKEKSEKKELSRQKGKEKRGVGLVDKTPIVRKDTLEIAEEKMFAKAKLRRQGILNLLDTLDLEREHKKTKIKTQPPEHEPSDEEEFDVDDFVQNNSILKKIHDLRMRVIKRKLKARALAKQKISSKDA